MAGVYTFFFYDLVTNTRKGQFELNNVRFSRLLNGAGTLSARLAISDRRILAKNPINATEVNRTAVYVDRDGSLVWGGILWTRRYDTSSQALDLGAMEFLSYFHQRNNTGRYITDLKTYTAQDQLFIVRDLINYAQSKPGGNIGITVGSEVSGVLRDRTYEATSYKLIGEAVNELSAVVGGFDYSIDVAWVGGVPTKTLTLSYPRRGSTVTTTGLKFEYPGNVTSYAFPEDGTEQANTAFAIGDGQGSTMMRSSSSIPAMIDQGYPLLELYQSYKGQNINQQATLDGHAQADVAAHASPLVLPDLAVRADRYPNLGAYTTGDDTRIRITDPRFPNPGYGGVDQHYDSYHRIVSYEVTVPDTSQAETVKITLGATG